MPHEPAIDGSESQLALFGTPARAANMVQYPTDFRSREIRVDQQTRLAPYLLLGAAPLQVTAGVGRSAILPDDGVIDRLAGVSIPDENRLALVGDADGGYVLRANAGLFEQLSHRPQLRTQDVGRVLFDPPGVRVNLPDIPLRLCRRLALPVEQHGAGAGRSLVE